MDVVLHWLRRAVELLLVPFDALPPLLALTLISVGTGAIALWIVGKTTRQQSLERARDRIAAGIYEIRLFLDSPRRVFAAQGRLLVDCLRYTAYLGPALLAMMIPLTALYLHLEPRYGLDALPAGTPLVVRCDLADGADGDAIAPAAEQDGLAVTAPPLFDQDRRAVYLRVVIDEPSDATLRVDTPGGTVDKLLAADPDAVRVAPERRSGIALLWSLGHEAPLPSDSGLTGISVVHPSSDRTWLGFGWPWWIYWLLVATVGALLLRRPMGVVI